MSRQQSISTLANLRFDVQKTQTAYSVALQENEKLLEELQMLRGIVEKKRLERLNMSDREKFISSTLMDDK